MFWEQERAKRISQELRNVQKKYENRVVATFDVCVTDMAKDAADSIDYLLAALQEAQEEVVRTTAYKSFADTVSNLVNCNDCALSRDCQYKPTLGKYVRFNCPLHVAPGEEKVILPRNNFIYNKHGFVVKGEL